MGDGLGIRLCHIILKQLVVNHQNLVGTVLDKRLGQVLDVLAKKHSDDLLVVGVGQLAGFAEKLKSHILQFAASLLGKHIYVFIFC